MSGILVTAEAIIPKYQGEIQDYRMQWTGRMACAAQAASGAGTGAWYLVGETGSAFTVFVPSGISASAVALYNFWTVYNSASGAGLTATGSASALISVAAVWRLSGGPASTTPYTCSAELRTSSGRFLYERFHIQVGS